MPTHHRSPNAGYPEAAMAGALDLSLADPRAYAGVRVGDAMMDNARRERRRRLSIARWRSTAAPTRC
jgi:cobalamin biosynthesis protein CobD/CbiB